MKVIIIATVILIVIVQAWSSVRNPFEIILQKQYHKIKECMHVASEEGNYSFKKIPHFISAPSLFTETSTNTKLNLAEIESSSKTVCGLYIVADPNKLIEITIELNHVNCETGGLMAFVDGWELNGEFFPAIKDHHLNLDNRITEFCNKVYKWPLRRTFRSSQNSALLQYRIPVRGSFLVNVRFIDNPKPCHVMVEQMAPYYKLTNSLYRNNCTLTALFPAVVSIQRLIVGGISNDVNYDCGIDNKLDRIDIGGSNGLDSYNMEKASTVCGKSDEPGPEQAIFCGVTTIRLSSSGNYNNHAIISIRPAEENDLSLATLICPS